MTKLRYLPYGIAMDTRKLEKLILRKLDHKWHKCSTNTMQEV
jgi:hypothetical protein